MEGGWRRDEGGEEGEEGRGPPSGTGQAEPGRLRTQGAAEASSSGAGSEEVPKLGFMKTRRQRLREAAPPALT